MSAAAHARREPIPARALLLALALGALLVLGPAAALGCRALFATDGGAPERSFGHAAHFKAIKDLQCTDCHKPLGAPETKPPAGAVAAPAPGASEAKTEGASAGKYYGLADWALCQRCHSPAKMPDLKPDVARFQVPRSVSTYDHEKHAKHSPMECVACHRTVVSSAKASDHLTPTMETCWTCHAKVTTFAGESGARCDLCHTATDNHAAGPEKAAVFAQVIEKKVPVADVPAEVMPAAHARLLGAQWLGNISQDQKPADHTEVFRTRTHGLRSQEPTAKCYACHTSQKCNECHETEPPPSHTLRFDRSTHGRAATLRRESCTACHQADMCQACHEIAPPGHTLAFRRDGAHGRSAKTNTRACFTCHAFGEDCARCHNR